MFKNKFESPWAHEPLSFDTLKITEKKSRKPTRGLTCAFTRKLTFAKLI